ncbi:Pre-mRNA splicing factor PRP21 like protein-domain-containing protein [Sphaerosporella brunnea]|uniref:Pre-mRNA splicing factor PRP21 like protein-domain-containing protein n=1 Tax=Sphaerosporella brunnea TaxID=1250544 RepID=A0A5J5EBP6_9PEZI|nr:Pre-mRNA splicing factor PRP21 like protein-domain-containing protein [Sphaerosporella brunnea]
MASLPRTPATPATPSGIDVSLEESSKPPPGIVLPPRDIRAIVEKTAGYVARNGQVFEQRIQEKEKHNPKFSFLAPADPYYQFYAWRLIEIRAGRHTSLSAGRVAAPQETKPAGPQEPSEFRFSARMPNISAQDLDILRLTAMFAAKHGRGFLTHLSQREARNYQFDFLRPNHSFYQYFSRLMDQYTELLQPRGGPSVEELTKNVKEKFHILEKATARAEWSKHQEKERAKKEEEEDQERLAYAQIDWHDFVVVETVVFTEADDQTDLPPPQNLQDLQFASLEQKNMMSLHPTQLRIEEAMPTDDLSAYYQQPAPPQPQPRPQQQQYPPPPPPQNIWTPPPAAPVQPQPQEQYVQPMQLDTHPKPASMKIRQAALPRALQKRHQEATGICPNCQQAIPLSEMEAHMRIELLDPRWKEQRARADAKFATTNLNTNDTVLNLKRLASQRDDLFDSTTGESITAEEAERRKKAATGGAWDGTAESRESVKMRSYDVNEQIMAIHRKAGQVANPGVGPQRQ